MPSLTDINALLDDHNRWWSDPNHRRARGRPQRRDRFEDVIKYVGDDASGRAGVLLGPRQVGKTTILYQIADELLDRGWPPSNLTFFDFSDDRLVEQISPREVAEARPPGLRDDTPRVYLFDEIQEARAWQRWLKAAVDESKRQPRTHRLLIIVTGSSAGSLREGTVESGQGRWDEIPIEGLTYREFVRLNSATAERDGEDPIQGILSLDPSLFTRYLTIGGFPEHARPTAGIDPLRQIRDDVIGRAVLRDLRGTGVDVDRVRRLLVYLVNNSGAIWNAQARAQDLGANRKTVEEWVSRLQETRLLLQLEIDLRPNSRASSQLRGRRRLYAADHGLITALSPFADPLGDSSTRGRVFEAAVFRHLREVVRTQGGRLGYLRDDDDLEIDFVWRPSRGQAIGIEVTSSKAASERKVSRLGRAAAKGDIGRKLVIYDGVVAERERNVEMVPAHEFLLSPSEFLEAR